MSKTQTVTDFIDAWNRMDWEAVEAAMTEDVVYHNIPLPPAKGRIAAMKVVHSIAPESVDWKILHIAEQGDAVLTERVDNFVAAGGKSISLPVMGIFEIEDGRIRAWRDYFDLATYTGQLKA